MANISHLELANRLHHTNGLDQAGVVENKSMAPIFNSKLCRL